MTVEQAARDFFGWFNRHYPAPSTNPDHDWNRLGVVLANHQEEAQAAPEPAPPCATTTRRYAMTDRQSTHGHDCCGWGPKHYECAVREVKRLRGALEECHARSVARWQRLLAAEAERKRLLRKKLTAAAEHPAPTEAEVLAAAKRAAAANSSMHEGCDLELFWSYLDERSQAHWLKVARAVLGCEG